jgi:hypothetical protein
MPQPRNAFADDESLERGKLPQKAKHNIFLRVCGAPWKELSTLEMSMRVVGWLVFWVVIGVIIGLIIRFT